MPDSANLAAPVIARIATDAVPVGQRLSLLGDELARRLASGSPRFLGGETPPLVDWTNFDFGQGLVLAQGRLGGMEVTRSQAMLRDGDDDATLFIAQTHGVMFEQNDRRTVMARGDGFFVAHARPVTSRWGDHRFQLLRIPRALLGPALRIEHAGGALLPAASETMQLVRAYLMVVQRRAMQGIGPSEIARRHLAELVAAGVAPTAAPPAEARDAARVAKILELVAARFGQRGFDMAQAAADVGVSERVGYQLFERAGLRFSQVLLAKRLDRAREILAAGSATTTLEIAMACGFGDLSHFNRTFKARFGVTPRSVDRPRSI